MVAPIRHTPVTGFAKKTAPKHWIWHGILAAGSITLMTSRWKTGKTTLLSVLLSKLGTGGNLPGRPIVATRAVVLSEESEELWEERHALLNFAENIHFACRPFGGRPTFDELKAYLLELEKEQEGPGLLVLDPLAMFLPGNAEAYAPAMIDTLSLLRRLTTLGWAILLLHHPIKGRNGRELIERCTASLIGFVDIEAKLYRDPDAITPRIRRMTIESRPYGFNSEFCIEFAADGKDFLAVEEEIDFNTYEEALPIIKAMIVDEGPMTRKQLWANWLEDFDRPSLDTLRRWLWRAQEEGVIEHTGSGRCRDPFVYRLKGVDPKPKRPDPHKVLNDVMRAMRNSAGAKGKEEEEGGED